LALNSKNNFDFVLRLVFSFLILLFLSIDTAFGATPNTDGWLLTQRHKQLGVNYVYLTHDAIKIVNKTLGFTIILGPPFRNVAIFRPADRVIFNSKPEDFQKTSFLPAIIASKPYRYQQLIKFGEEEFHGLHVEKFHSRKDEHDQLWTISNIDLSPSILAVVHTYYQIDNPLLPFRKINNFGTNKSDHLNLWMSVSINEGYQGKTTFLDTVDAKKMKFAAAEFAYPVGFKKLDNAGEAFVSPRGATQLGNIINDLNLGEDLGTKPKDVKKPDTDKKSDTVKR
jgi:hypothetical protein